MKAELKEVFCPDISDLETYCPEDENTFCFYLELLIGEKDKSDSEVFGITVCTPRWLLKNHKSDEILFLRHHLVVFEYHYTRIIQAIRNKITLLSAKNWDELALKISRFCYWEFEDYEPYANESIDT